MVVKAPLANWVNIETCETSQEGKKEERRKKRIFFLFKPTKMMVAYFSCLPSLEIKRHSSVMEFSRHKMDLFWLDWIGFSRREEESFKVEKLKNP